MSVPRLLGGFPVPNTNPAVIVEAGEYTCCCANDRLVHIHQILFDEPDDPLLVSKNSSCALYASTAKPLVDGSSSKRRETTVRGFDPPTVFSTHLVRRSFTTAASVVCSNTNSARVCYSRRLFIYLPSSRQHRAR